MEQRKTTVELIELYLAQGKALGTFNNKTYKDKNNFFKRFIVYLAGRELNMEIANGYSVYLAEKGDKTGSIRNYLTHIRSFVNWLADQDYIAKNYATKIKRPPESKNNKFYPSMDVAMKAVEAALVPSPYDNAVNKAAKETARLLFVFDLSSGLRNQELRSLRVKDFDFAAGKYVVTRKGGKLDEQPIPPNLTEQLKNWCSYKREDEKVFPIHPDSLNNMLARGSVILGLKDKLTVHSLRHIFASHMAGNDIPQWRLQKLLGHAKLETSSKYYIHATIAQQQAAMVHYHDEIKKSMSMDQKWEYAMKIVNDAKLGELGLKLTIDKETGKILIERPT